MGKGADSGKRVDKRPKHSGEKHTHRSDKDKKRAMSAGAAGSSDRVSDVYTEPGPHGSTIVKAVRGSQFLHARGGSYAIRENAYMKEVFGASGEHTVVMNCEMSPGVLIRPNERLAKFEFPDGTFLHCVPVCDVRVLSMRSVFNGGRGREYIHSASEVYGRDSALLQMRTRIVDKIKRHASKVYSKQYEKDKIFSLGEADEDNPDVTMVPCRVRKHAKFVADVRGKVYEKGLARVVGWDNKDVEGDALISLKYVRDAEKKTAELLFELQDVMVRRGVERLFGGSSAA